MNEQRGANIKLFGPDRVRQFCVRNDIEVIVTPSRLPSVGYDMMGGGQRIRAACGAVRHALVLVRADHPIAGARAPVRDARV